METLCKSDKRRATDSFIFGVLYFSRLNIWAIALNYDVLLHRSCISKIHVLWHETIHYLVRIIDLERKHKLSDNFDNILDEIEWMLFGSKGRM